MRTITNSGRWALATLGVSAAIGVYAAGGVRLVDDAGFSDGLWVGLQSTEPESLTIFTPNAEAPRQIPIGILTDINDKSYPAVETTPEDWVSVTTTFGGTLSSTFGAPTVNGALQTVDASPLIYALSGAQFLAVVDASLLDFKNVSRGTTAGLIAGDIVRTVVVANNYYDQQHGHVGLSTEVGSLEVEITLQDLNSIDADANGIPDATALLQSSLYLMNANEVFTKTFNTDERSGVWFAVRSSRGPFLISVSAPRLQDLVAADPESFGLFTGSCLIISIAEDATALLDGPGGVDPLSEFDLTDGGEPLPIPGNLFIRTALALTGDARSPQSLGNLDGGNSRGDPAAWTFVDRLPGELRIRISILGPPIQDQLDDLAGARAYTYDVSYSQSGEDVLAAGAEQGWRSETIEIDPYYPQFTVATDRASSIFGTNAIPSTNTTSGSGGGQCFIATAAYGTPMARELHVLRSLRDGYLMEEPVGAAFVDAYYRLSPPIAGAVSENEALRIAVRATLSAAIALGTWFLTSPISLVVAVLAALSAFGGVAWRAHTRITGRP